MRVLEKRERESVCVDAFKSKTARGHQGEREREREGVGDLLQYL